MPLAISRGLATSLTAVLLWALGLTLIKYLSFFFGVLTQNFFRYLSAGAFMLILLYYSQGRHGIRFRATLKRSLIPAAFVTAFQTLTVYGVYTTKATIAAFLLRLSVVFVGLFSYILFREERAILVNRWYIIGTVISMTGVMGMSLKFDQPSVFLDYGALLVLLGSAFWGFYIVSLRFYLRDEDPLPFTSAVFSISSMMFLPLAILEGGIRRIQEIPPSVGLLLPFSGIIAVGLGNWMNMIAIKELGAVIPSTLQLLTPFVATVFLWIVVGEVATPIELLFGLLVVTGCGIVVKATTAQRSR